MKFFDSHCHLQFDAFDEKRDDIIKELIENQSKVVNVGSSIENSRAGVLLTEKYPETFIASVGVHPFHSLGFEIYKDNDESKKYDINYPQDLSKLEQMATSKSVRAIGECGIDFSYLKGLKGSEADIEAWKQKQIDCFDFQIELAKKVSLPLILHIRKEYLLAFDIIKKHEFEGKVLVHFFKGKMSDFEILKNQDNFYFGFSNVVTYDDTMDQIIKDIDMSKILIETDAPYVPPMEKKGEINEPKNVWYVAQKIAGLKGIEVQEVLEKTFENACKFFGV